ncbi:hypothetical protein, partial [Enterococcus faecium]|uniref:hypothetical protein n=1 Tax=Enterococcus faecium TaxID=1352 RepID=UPI003F43AB19
ARFVDWGAAERFFRARLAGFGAAPEKFVSDAIRATLREGDDGVVPRQDPAVTASLAGFAEAEDQDLRRVFARVRVPVLVIRGAASTLLTEAT